MEHLEEIGLLKMDFLGLRNLTLLESIVSSIHKKTGRKIDIKTLPLNDEKTFELLARGETTGIFQLESEGMRKVLLRLKPSRFEDIVAVNALYRPGPMENIPLFIDRKHGRQAVEYPHKDLEPILENTYGVIVYQEQIMQIASTMAGFSLGEADLLRRAVGKKQKDVLDRERNHFVQGALKKGYEQVLANDIYDLIVRFANYGFNRSHAVAYSMIAYQLAYLKANNPLYFMAGLLTSAIGNETKIAQYIMESKQKDIEVLPPSINYSGFSFQVEKTGIRYSLAAIKSVGAAALREIFQARKSKKFEDLFDFCTRVSPKAINRKTLEVLVHSGSFDEFNEDVQVDPIRLEDKLSFEKEALGFYLSDHPVAIFEKRLKQAGAFVLFELSAEHKRAASGVYIVSLRKIRTKKGDSMAFLNVSDSSGEMEAVAFPIVYKKYPHLLDHGKFVVMEGKVEERDGKLQFIIQQVSEIEPWLSTKTKKESILYLKIVQGKQDEHSLNQLKQLFKGNTGKTKVVLHYETRNKTIRLGDEFMIEPSSTLLKLLSEFLGNNNVVLKE
jgi:DNA polymerase-3 subunit alpha